MADSKHTDVVQAVAARMATILVANGYETNVGQNVFVWKTDDFDEDTVPGMDIRDVQSVDQPQSPSIHTHRLTFEVRLVAASASSTDTVRKMIGDVYKAIGTDMKWGGLAVWTDWEQHKMQVNQLSRRVSGALVQFSVVYRTNAFDPFN